MNKLIIILLFVFLISLFSVNAIYLKLVESESLADAHMDTNAPDTNHGGDDFLTVYGGSSPQGRIYGMFNITKIPAGVTINHANVTFTNYVDDFDGIVSIFEVNATWDESVITWNNQPCGSGFEFNAANCNVTDESNVTATEPALNTWNITGMLKRAISSGRNNVSFVIASSEVLVDLSDNYRSKEYATVADRPFMEVDYTEAEPPDLTPPQTTFINATCEGGLGQIIFDVGVTDNRQPGAGVTIPRVNDTTCTFFAKTDEAATCAIINQNRDLNWTDIFDGNRNFDTEATTHTLTLNASNSTGPLGEFNLSIGCKDSSGNENISSTSGKFLLNLTDITPPVINGTQNITTIFSGDVLNATFNMTDNKNSINGTIISNSTGYNRYFNFSFVNYVAGTTQEMSQNFTITGTSDVVINITGIAIDNNSNRRQNESIFIFVPDITPPNITILSPVNNSVINVNFVDLNWTSDESLDWCAYSLDGGENDTSICNGTIYCYQEFANVSTSCGGLNTGKYSCEGDWLGGNPCENIFDGDFITFGSSPTLDTGYFYVNYTKPVGAISSSLWRIKEGGTLDSTVDLPISSNCWNHDANKLIFRVEHFNIGAHVKWYCKDGAATWELLDSLGQFSYPHEEAMRWNLSEFGVSGLNANNITLTSLSNGLHNVTIWANDSLGNMGQSDYTYFTITDILPSINATINNTFPKINEIVNLSGNATDNVALSFCQAIINQTGAFEYFNFSLAGTRAECSQNFTISVIRGNVINFTMRVNDTANGFTMNDTIITVADTEATISIALNNTSPIIGNVINVSSTVTDADGLSFCLIKTNQTGVFTNNTFELSGTTGFCSDLITVNLHSGNVINFTIEINDSVGGIIYENSTKVTVTGSTTPTNITLINLTSEGGLGQIIYKGGFFNLEDDIEDEFACVSSVTGCGFAVDETWNTSNATATDGSPTPYVFINYTVPFGYDTANITVKCRQQPETSFLLEGWNYSQNNFQSTNRILGSCNSSSSDVVNLTINLGEDYLDGSKLRLRFRLGLFGSARSNLYEEKVLWLASDFIDNRQNGIIAKTNDTTPSYFVKTNQTSKCAVVNHNTDINYSDITAGNSDTKCEFTGGTTHTCTLPDANATTSIGLHNFTISCNTTDGIQRLTSDSGLFNVEITDGVPPKVDLDKPIDDVFFILEVNNTIKFNATSTDNFDSAYNCSLLVNDVQVFSNASYANGTEFNFTKTITEIGTYVWNVTCTDSFNNVNSSQRSFTLEQEETVNLFLDGLNESRKYEFRTKVNLSANCTHITAGTCQVEIDLDAPGFGFNFSSGDNFTSFIYNITTLRIKNFSNGEGSHTLGNSGEVNITSNNLTKMVLVELNLTSAGESTNINISYGQTKTLRGTLKTQYLEVNQFIHNNEFKDAINLTYLTGGSDFISYDISGIDNPINITFIITGFNLDEDNEFSYIEHFNGTDGARIFNETLSFQTDTPLGVFDDFEGGNNSQWFKHGGTGGATVSFTDSLADDYLDFNSIGSEEGFLTYNDNAADFRNSSKLEIINRYRIFIPGCSNPCDRSNSANIQFYVTDGTSRVQLVTDSLSETGQGSGSDIIKTQNYTFERRSDDFKTWEFFINGSSQGNKDLSSLDFNQQIKPEWKTSTGTDGPDVEGNSLANWRLFIMKTSGAYLNRNTNNGTYKSEGNITQCVNRTASALSRATLSKVDYVPDNTRIDYYLSNNNGTTFETVIPDILHVFDSSGSKNSEICWRGKLNSSVNVTSLIIRRVGISIVKASAENVTIDVQNDGTIEASFLHIINSSTSPITVNLTPEGTGIVDIKISSATSGQLQINQFSLNASMNPVSLNASRFENCFDCSINITFGGDDIIVSDLKFDFLGSWNYTATARYNNLKDTKTIQVYYSDFNLSLPGNLDFYDVFPSSASSKNVTPFGQTDSLGIWNATNLAYDESIDIYVKTNETPNVCMNVTYTNNSFRFVDVANESFVWINATNMPLNNKDIVVGSDIVFNQTSGEIVGSNNYTINYTDGIITLNSSISTNTTKINDTANINLLAGGSNSSLLEFIPLNSESVRNATAPFALLNKDVDYRIDYALKNFTLINETFNNTQLFITYNYSVYSSFGNNEQFGINYSYSTSGYNLNTDYTFRLNTSYQKIITNISVGFSPKDIWNWWDFYSCTTQIFIPYVFFAATCTSCFFEETQLDNYNIIIT